MKKFDFAIGNPPYQESMDSTSDKPVYNDFMDAAYEVADKVELITPARFLFNAGKTPKAWNEKMLSDPHLKVSYYEQDSSKVFTNTDIKGGVAVTYRDDSKIFGAIKTFTQFPVLNHILAKVNINKEESLSSFIFSPESYKMTDIMHQDFPTVISMLSKGHSYDVTSNIFEKLYNVVFFDDNPGDDEYIRLIGRKDNSRSYMWVKRCYIAKHDNLDRYKVFLPKANGSGTFGEVLSGPIVGEPGIGHTQTFISIGAFETRYEAESSLKYLKCKFTRAMLGVLKVTQDNKKSVWAHIPIQNFTAASDINWSVSIANIDQQLYKKYGLTDEEIAFIETNVKEME